MTKAEEALQRVVQGQSMVNYDAIFDGFEAMGISTEDIKPRENVFTFKAWKALGRHVKKGEHGVKVVTMIPCSKREDDVDEEGKRRMRPKTTTVFHISQTEKTEKGKS